MKVHLLVGAAMLAAALAGASARGNESKGSTPAGVGASAPTSQHLALRTSLAPAHASAASKPRKGQAYLDTQQTFAGVTRGTKTSGVAGDDWSTGASSKSSQGKVRKKDSSK